MGKILKADTRSSTEIMHEIKKMPKHKKSDTHKPERTIRN